MVWYHIIYHLVLAFDHSLLTVSATRYPFIYTPLLLTMPRVNPLVKEAKRRTPFYVICVFLVTISFAILSLFKLEPVAQNLVEDHNSNFDSLQLVKSTVDTPQDAKIEDKEKTTSDWAQPTRNLEAPPGELKLVRIGTGGPVDNARGFLLDNLEEFLQV